MVLPITCAFLSKRTGRQHICLDIGTKTSSLLLTLTGEQRQFWSLEVTELNSEPDCSVPVWLPENKKQSSN